MHALYALLEGSCVPEDTGHARDTLRWLLRLAPRADWALRFAAQAHDVDRALPEDQRTCRRDFPDYESFKAAHAANSARVATALLRKAGAPSSVLQDVARLVYRHEHAQGDARQVALCDADALSFYTHNLPYYLLREGWAEARRRARWGAGRLSPEARQRLIAFPFADPRIQMLVHDACVADSDNN